MLKQVILYRHQYDLCYYFTPFWKMKSKAGQYGWEKNIFFPFACKQVTGHFAAPKIDTWRHLENLDVDHVVV